MQNWLKIISVLLFLSACSSETKQENLTKATSNNSEDETGFAWFISNQEIQGNTQGSTFTIKTSDDSLLTSVFEVESLLLGFDLELSGYIDNSLLSLVNSSINEYEVPENRYFDTCYALSQAVYSKTNGAFDPSVFPLVKAWGFFKDSSKLLSQKEVDSCLTFIGFEPGNNHSYTNRTYTKFKPQFKIDFNAIAQGYSVDVLADYLENKGQQNYMVEIGGEVKVRGLNHEGKPWNLGVDKPTEVNAGYNDRKLENVLKISEGALATSGNYRKFHVVDGKKYSHTLNPQTGCSVTHTLLSATVWSKQCALADAYATAFMVMGKNKTLKFLEQHPELDLEVYLLFSNEQDRIERAYTSGMFEMMQN